MPCANEISRVFSLASSNQQLGDLHGSFVICVRHWIHNNLIPLCTGCCLRSFNQTFECLSSSFSGIWVSQSCLHFILWSFCSSYIYIHIYVIKWNYFVASSSLPLSISTVIKCRLIAHPSIHKNLTSHKVWVMKYL